MIPSRKPSQSANGRILVNIARSHPQTITISCSKKDPPSNASLVRLLNSEPAPCKVLSNHRRALSAPLSHYTYCHEIRAFTNKEGCTWTPSYLKYCQPTISHQLLKAAPTTTTTNTTNDKCNIYAEDIHKRKTNILSHFAIKNAPIVVSSSSLPWSWTRDKKRPTVVSYSKFMESPYLRRKHGSCNVSKLQS